MHVGPDRSLGEARTPGELLEEALGLEVHGHLDAGEPGRELVKGDHAGVLEAVHAAPDDPLVGPLLHDLGLEVAAEAPHLLGEGDVGLVVLAGAVDPVHEARVLLELGPLVVCHVEGHRDIHGLLDGHAPAAARGIGLGLSAVLTIVVVTGHDPVDELAAHAELRRDLADRAHLLESVLGDPLEPVAAGHRADLVLDEPGPLLGGVGRSRLRGLLDDRLEDLERRIARGAHELGEDSVGLVAAVL